jgi:hypothetical protein
VNTLQGGFANYGEAWSSAWFFWTPNAGQSLTSFHISLGDHGEVKERATPLVERPQWRQCGDIQT